VGALAEAGIAVATLAMVLLADARFRL